MSSCLIGLGSNLGDRHTALEAAVARLAESLQLRLLSRSAWLETLPAGGPTDQPSYLNGAALVDTSLAPQEVLARLREIETALGRSRVERWGPRTLDLDLLLYDDLVLDTPSLVVPHPRMAWRRFVLEPVAQIAPAMVHPQIGWTVGRLLAHLNSTPWYAAIVGDGDLAAEVARRSGARLLDRGAAGFWGRGLAPFAAQQPEGWFAQMVPVPLSLPQDPAASLDRPIADRPRQMGPGTLEFPEDRPTVSDIGLDDLAALQSGQAVRPRLVVLVDPPCRQSLPPIPGPVLRLPGLDREADVSEVLAALAAMR